MGAGGVEKCEGSTPQVATTQRTVTRSTWTRSLAISAVALLLLFKSLSFLPSPRTDRLIEADNHENVEVLKPFRWSDVTPSKELQYHDCDDGLQCARLDVPLNYKRTDGKGQKVAIALVRRPAKVPITDPRYGGAVIIEPGGPGGSGTSFQQRFGSEIQYVTSSSADPTLTSTNSTDKYYDVIGFDPRGVKHTTPKVACFPDTFSSQNWRLQFEAAGILGSSDQSLHNNWRRARALADGCSESLLEEVDGDRFGEHINTTPVIEDIIQMIERHGQWREKQAIAAQAEHARIYGIESTSEMLARAAWKKGEEKIHYWGFSYGTVIGATFAAMHPQRIERMVLDGVCDADDFYGGTWFSALWDTDSVLERFFVYCDEAGPLKCAFHRPGGVHAIRAAYDKLLLDIFNDPLSVPASKTRGPYLVTWSDIKLMLSPGLYQPLFGFPRVASLLQDLTIGNGSLFADFKESNRIPTCPSSQCSIDGPWSDECTEGDALNAADASSAILCTDGPGLGEIDEPAFKIYWDTLRQQSSAMGDFWAHTRLGCVGWKARASWRYSGPFSSNNLSHPILFVGNTLDTVTPIRNARKMALQFPGSVVLEQKAEGHCSFAAPSVCTSGHVKRYFQTGILPSGFGEEEMTCETDAKPLLDYVPPRIPGLDPPKDGDGDDGEEEVVEMKGDRRLWEASRKFAEESPGIHFLGGMF